MDCDFAIGAYGSYFTTTDGGTTWEYEPIAEDDWHLHQISRSDNGKLYLAAEAGFLIDVLGALPGGPPAT